MSTIIAIIAVFAVIGGIIGFLSSGGDPKETAGSAAGGALSAIGCLVQLVIYGIMALAGIWIIRMIFFS